MNIRLVTYSDQNMSISRKKCIQSFLDQMLKEPLKVNGISVHEWDREMIEATEFYQLNREILDTPRGSGLWAWKSYIIYKAMLDMADEDILVYSDAGVEFINSVHHIINAMDQDLFLFGNNYNHVDFCKGDVFKIINGWDIPNDEQRRLKQIQASVMFFRISDFSKLFVKNWLLYSQMAQLINDEPSKHPNVETYVEGRHDQQIATALAIKYNIPLHWWCANYNNGAFVYDKIDQYKSDAYPVLFHHHRRRQHEW